ncbi:MAG: hypothetical protein AB1758_24970 [Candidatus Eremiobacterota bacterium]
MQNLEAVNEKLALLRSRLHRAHVSSGRSTHELAVEMGMTPQDLADCLSGRKDLSVGLLLRLGQYLDKPIWWFFGERPEGITLEEAETALKNLERVRLLVEGLESQFFRVTGGPASSHELPRKPEVAGVPPRVGEVVDLAFYRARARAILEREKRTGGYLDEESIEMVAQGLYNAERRASQEE